MQKQKFKPPALPHLLIAWHAEARLGDTKENTAAAAAGETDRSVAATQVLFRRGISDELLGKSICARLDGNKEAAAAAAAPAASKPKRSGED